MRTLRGRFVLSHILPLLLVIPLVGAVLVYILETQVLLADLSQDLTREAKIIAQVIDVNPEFWTDSDRASAFVSGVSIHLDGHVLLLQPDGQLLATSDPADLELVGELVDLEGLEAVFGGNSSVIVTYGWTQQSAEVLVPVTGAQEQLIGIIGLTQTLEGVASEFGRLRWLVLAILVTGLVLGGAIGYVLAIRLERPITRAATAVIEIAEGQRVGPIPEAGPTEIRQLSGSVNILAERLRLLEDTRRRLLANLVHELGRPLGAIRSAIHVLIQGAGEDPEIRQELLVGIEDEIERMQPLLDELAQLHGQVLGTLELERHPVNLSEWLPPLLLPWRASALDKELDWQATIPDGLPVINVDSDRLGQAIGNLLSNAIKYTPSGGRVTVIADADGEETWITISDSGYGVVAEEQEKIFEPFYRSRQERRFPQGMGLGLTIALDLVEAHGGWLEMESDPGEGSQFTIHLPLGTLAKESADDKKQPS